MKETILAAQIRIKEYVHHTEVLTSTAINQYAGAELYFKCENFQKVGAFKARGAFNFLLQLPTSELAKGVCTHSSGNHAQALALAGKTLQVPAYIVMPSNAPKVKVAAVKEYGAIISFCEPTLEARESTLSQVQEQTGACFVPPYNHQWIIEGQATASLELLQSYPQLDIMIAPVGGGGLLSGTCLSAKYFSEAIVYGAEPEGADDAYRSITTGKRVESHSPKTIADGLLTTLGDQTFPIIKEHVQGILLVNDQEIIQAMKLIWERMKVLVEPSAAVPLAAVLRNPNLFEGKKIGIILSGGNVDLKKLPF